MAAAEVADEEALPHNVAAVVVTPVVVGAH